MSFIEQIVSLYLIVKVAGLFVKSRGSAWQPGLVVCHTQH